MKTLLIATAVILSCGLAVGAESPLAKPLADFDKLAAELNSSSLVAQPIRAGSTAIVPFSEIKFELGGGGIPVAFGGGMGAHTIPLGVVIVEGADVRVELFGQDEPPTVLEQILQTIRDRKLVIMGNGLNIGHLNGGVQDLAPLISAMMGQTAFVGNALNLGSLANPADAKKKK